MSDSNPWWKDYPWRIVQTNMREIDMADIDAKRYVDELKSFDANMVIINTGGIVANYDTQFDFHHKNTFLTGDSLETVIAACREAGIRVASRVDFSKVRRYIYEKHPDWAFVDTEGQIIDYHGDVHVCFNSDYQRHHAIAIMREIIEKLDPDSIFMNMAGYYVAYDYDNKWHGICQCGNCRRRFHDWSGLDLPKKEDPDDPVFRRYLKFQAETTAQYWQSIKDMIRETKPELLFFHTDMLRGEAGTFLMSDRMNYLYKASEIMKEEKTSNPDKVASATSVDFIDMNYRFAAVSPYQQQLRVAQTLANGGFADFYQVGRLDNHPDKSGYEPLKTMFQYHKDHEEDYHSHDSLSDILLVKPNTDFFEFLIGADSGAEYTGWFNLLTQRHYLFDCVNSGALSEKVLSKYRAVILPDIRKLDESRCKVLDAYVFGGGTLIAAGQSAHFDAEGDRVFAPQLQSLGVEQTCFLDPSPMSAYFLVGDKTLFPQFGTSDYCYLRGPYSYADYAGTAEKYMRLIPPHRHSPAESAYPTNITDYPAVTLNRYGAGRGVCIPWCPGAEYRDNAFPHMSNFMSDVLEHLLGFSPCGGNLPPMVEVEYAKRPDDSVRYLHLVNHTGHFLRAYFAPVPLTNLTVAFPAPVRTPRSAVDMVTGKSCEFSVSDGIMTVAIERLDLLGAVRIE